MQIVLATSSPYRRRAFSYLSLFYVWEASRVDEQFAGRPPKPKELVVHLARLKAEAVAKNHPNSIIVGFDSVGWINGNVLEKPKTKKEAFTRLKTLSGKGFLFFTGIHMINTVSEKSISEISKTEVFIRHLTDEEISKYLNEDKNYKTYSAGFDPVAHYSSTFTSKIVGSYNNIFWGIPLELLPGMLEKIGYK